MSKFNYKLLKESFEIKGPDGDFKKCVTNAEIHQESILGEQKQEENQSGSIPKNYIKNKNSESKPKKNKKKYSKEGYQNKVTNTEVKYDEKGTKFCNNEKEKNQFGPKLSTTIAGDIFSGNVPIESLGSLAINLKKNKTSKFKVK